MKCAISILGLSALSASIFALDIEILLYPDENLVRKWILKGTKLKTPFHIALFRKDFRSHCTFFQGRNSAMPVIRADLFLAISKTGMCLLNISVFKRFTILVPS